MGFGEFWKPLELVVFPTPPPLFILDFQLSRHIFCIFRFYKSSMWILVLIFNGISIKSFFLHFDIISQTVKFM